MILKNIEPKNKLNFVSFASNNIYNKIPNVLNNIVQNINLAKKNSLYIRNSVTYGVDTILYVGFNVLMLGICNLYWIGQLVGQNCSEYLKNNFVLNAIFYNKIFIGIINILANVMGICYGHLNKFGVCYMIVFTTLMFSISAINNLLYFDKKLILTKIDKFADAYSKAFVKLVIGLYIIGCLLERIMKYKAKYIKL